MSITKPPDAVLRATDWDALRDIEKRADALYAAKALDGVAFAKLWAEGLAATKNHPELLQTLDMIRPSAA